MKYQFKADVIEPTDSIQVHVSNDRVSTRPDYVEDPLRDRRGVFALLELDEMSDAEQRRFGHKAEMSVEPPKVQKIPTLWDKIKSWF